MEQKDIHTHYEISGMKRGLGKKKSPKKDQTVQSHQTSLA